MNVVVAGGTGFIGSALIDALLARGNGVIVLTRRPEEARRRWEGRLKVRDWDGRNPGPWVQSLDGADAVVNLCGAGVADRLWTPQRKQVLIKSRLEPTRALVSGLRQTRRRPKTLLNASAVGYYGSSPPGDCPESAPPGADFLAALCGQWEREARAAQTPGVRVALSRTGVVLDRGGALARMLLPFKLGLGGRLGSGRQPFPWVQREDAAEAMIFALERGLSGPFNLVAPEPVSNVEFARALGRALRRPAVLPVPAFALRLALGELSSMLLDGQRALPGKLMDAGYRFRHPTLDAALRAALGLNAR